MKYRRMHKTNVYSNVCQNGSILLSLIFSIVFIGVLAVAIVSTNTTGMMNFITYNNNENAYYLAEAGMRYASSLYKYTVNENENANADDEKAKVLEDVLDGSTFSMDYGKFVINIYPYWLVANADYTKEKTIYARFCGTKPDNFSFAPTTKIIFLGSNSDSIEAPVHDFDYQKVDSGYKITLKQGQMTLQKNEAVYFAFAASKNNEVVNSDNDEVEIDLDISQYQTIPQNNGFFQVKDPNNSDHQGRKFFYKKAFSKSGDERKTILSGITPVTPITTTDYFKVKTTNPTYLIFKKTMILESTGKIGDEKHGSQRKISYYIPIEDSLKDSENININIASESGFYNNFDTDNDEINIGSSFFTQRSGSTAVLQFTSIAKDYNDKYASGDVYYSHQDVINNFWRANKGFLNYDLQVKLSTGYDLLFGAAGLSFKTRTKKNNSNKDKIERNLGLSYMVYYDSTNSIGDFYGTFEGDRIPDEIKPPQVGTPVEWSIGKDWWEYVGSGYWRSGFNSYYYIPTSYRDSFRIYEWGGWSGYLVPGSDPGDHNIVVDKYLEKRKLLLVLWERKRKNNDVNQPFIYNWIAYKNISHDSFVLGTKDINSNFKDGVWADGSTLMVRVREELDSNDEKVVLVDAYYGDASIQNSNKDDTYPVPANPFRFNVSRTRDEIEHNILKRRGCYNVSNADDWEAIWASEKMTSWNANIDYFSRIYDANDQYNENRNCYWDAFNPDIVASEDITQEGLIIHGFSSDDFDSNNNNDYNQPEFGLHAFGHISTTPYRPISFNDFGAHLISNGHLAGGFYPGYQF